MEIMLCDQQYRFQMRERFQMYNGYKVDISQKILTVTSSTGLVITCNTNTTEYMKTKETINVSNIDTELNGQNLERVGSFKYLGSIITTQDEIEYDIITAAASQCFHTLNKMLSKR
jgi:hypothetical protein